MSLEQRSDLEKSISAGNAEQLRNALSTIVGAELADRDLDSDEDVDPEPVRVTIRELARSCPVPETKCRALMRQFAAEPGTGISSAGVDEYEIDPTV